MSMYSASVQQNQPARKKLSKKEIFKEVYISIANSLKGFNLSGKKFEANLEKTSKLFTKEISKAIKKKKKNDKVAQL